jgi:hypothetical protein
MENNKKNNTIGAVPKSTRKIVEICKIDTPNKQEHDRSHCWRGTGSLQYTFQNTWSQMPM